MNAQDQQSKMASCPLCGTASDVIGQTTHVDRHLLYLPVNHVDSSGEKVYEMVDYLTTAIHLGKTVFRNPPTRCLIPEVLTTNPVDEMP